MASKPDTAATFARWRKDPVAFVQEALRNPETSAPFEIYPAQAEFLRRAFTLTLEGRLPYPEILFSAPKKSGKTGLAAMCAILAAVVIGGPYAEIYCLANDFEQSQGRVFAAAARIIQASPLLRNAAKVTASKIEFPASGAFIQAVASDFAGFAGVNPTLCIFDELWGYTSESSRRLWDESAFSPTRKVSGRLTVTYAGFEGESELLEGLYQKAMAGNEVSPDFYDSPGQLTYWTHTGPAPWQDDAWRERMRQTSRPNAYLRHVENRWVSSESKFITAEQFDACVDSEARPVLADHSLQVYCGLDASLRHDTTALVGVAYDAKLQRVRLVAHRLFRPQGEDIDFGEVENAVVDFRNRFAVQSVSYDPYQLEGLGQRLRAKGVNAVALDQTLGNLTAAASGLFELFQGRNIALYPDPDVREAVLNAAVKEATSGRGYRLCKEKPSKKIDLCAALSFACLKALKDGAGCANSFANALAILPALGRSTAEHTGRQ
jgi:phage terminase large subunit-like protein